MIVVTAHMETAINYTCMSTSSRQGISYMAAPPSDCLHVPSGSIVGMESSSPLNYKHDFQKQYQ